MIFQDGVIEHSFMVAKVMVDYLAQHSFMEVIVVAYITLSGK
jgi:hypothetical protein